jgi:predicted porin
MHWHGGCTTDRARVARIDNGAARVAARTYDERGPANNLENALMRHQRIGLALAVAVAAALAPTAPKAVEVAAGDWKFTLNGNVNADYIHSSCQSNPSGIAGGLACTEIDGQSTASSVSNGLLPAAFVFGVATTQNGLDITGTFGMYPGTSTNDGGDPNHAIGGTTNTGLGTAGLDIRQVYMTFGNKDMGTFTVGRNIGLFQQDVILNDMTLPGVGGPGGAATGLPGNTTLGSIGLGYIYTDWLSQIDYTTPDMGGTKVTFGIFDPLNPVGEPSEPKSAPGFHGKIAFTQGGLYLSASGLYQKQTAIPSAGIAEYSSDAFDVGGKYDIAGFEVMGWYYHAKGVGTTALFLLGADAAGDPRTSDGFLAQLTYTIGPTKFGVNYGESRLHATSEEAFLDPVATAALVEDNKKVTVGVYHKLTPNLTILGEFSKVTSEAQSGAIPENTGNTFNIGAFLSF